MDGEWFVHAPTYSESVRPPGARNENFRLFRVPSALMVGCVTFNRAKTFKQASQNCTGIQQQDLKEREIHNKALFGVFSLLIKPIIK